MDWLRRMNRVLDYIEDHLKDEIDFDEIGRLSLCPSGLFQRVFSTMTGISLSEYIRHRKLSKAAMELSDTDRSVLEIALDYGYESVDAFSAAFKRLNEITPTQAKEPGALLKHYPRLSFTMTLKGEMEMQYKMIKKPAFTVIGKSIVTTQEENMKNQSIPKFWAACNQNGVRDALCKAESKRPLLGICYDEKPDGTFRYMVGVESDKKVPDLESLTIQKANWAVFDVVGPMPGAIQKVWNDIFQNFLPSGNYDHANMPDFEAYPEDNPDRPDYHSEIWIPVVPKK